MIYVWFFLDLDYSILVILFLNLFYFIFIDLWKRLRKSKIDLGLVGGFRIDFLMGFDFLIIEVKIYFFKLKLKLGRLRWSLFYSCFRDMGIE